jgi:hypothetical protein
VHVLAGIEANSQPDDQFGVRFARAEVGLGDDGIDLDVGQAALACVAEATRRAVLPSTVLVPSYTASQKDTARRTACGLATSVMMTLKWLSAMRQATAEASSPPPRMRILRFLTLMAHSLSRMDGYLFYTIRVSR